MASNQLRSSVRRSIINDNDSVIGVVLLDNRFEVPQISIVGLVFVTWNHYAHRQFFWVFTDLVFFLEGLYLSVSYDLHFWVGTDIDSDHCDVLEGFVHLSFSYSLYLINISIWIGFISRLPTELSLFDYYSIIEFLLIINTVLLSFLDCHLYLFVVNYFIKFLEFVDVRFDFFVVILHNGHEFTLCRILKR